MAADRKLRTDIMINIFTYVPLFTRWKEHREGRLWGDVGAGDCDLPDGENDISNQRIWREIMI
jgi:hypothetical protein